MNLFNQNKICAVLIGGTALNLYKSPRLSYDSDLADFLLAGSHCPKAAEGAFNCAACLDLIRDAKAINVAPGEFSLVYSLAGKKLEARFFLKILMTKKGKIFRVYGAMG